MLPIDSRQECLYDVAFLCTRKKILDFLILFFYKKKELFQFKIVFLPLISW